MKSFRDMDWKRPFPSATIISIFILGLFYDWFAIANRHIIFLYNHTAVGIPLSLPFDDMTRSRYWMAGLVAAGMVMIVYAGINWLRARVSVWQKHDFHPLNWWQVWLLTLPPIIIGIPAITMTVNVPTLPPQLAVSCVIATLLGLIVALLPGKWAAEQPVDLLWLITAGSLAVGVTIMRRRFVVHIALVKTLAS